MKGRKGMRLYHTVQVTWQGGEGVAAAARDLMLYRFWGSNTWCVHLRALVSVCAFLCALTCTGLCLTSLLPGELSPEACWRRNCLAAWSACKGGRDIEMTTCASHTQTHTYRRLVGWSQHTHIQVTLPSKLHLAVIF